MELFGRRKKKAPEKSLQEVRAEIRAVETETVRGIESVIRETVGSLIDDGRVIVEESDWGDEFPKSLFLSPTETAGTSISVWPDGMEIGVSVGEGSIELWTNDEMKPLDAFREILSAVSEGRYAEHITRGWVLARKIEMVFFESDFGPCKYAYLGESGEGIPLGSVTYEPW